MDEKRLAEILDTACDHNEKEIGELYSEIRRLQVEVENSSNGFYGRMAAKNANDRDRYKKALTECAVRVCTYGRDPVEKRCGEESCASCHANKVLSE